MNETFYGAVVRLLRSEGIRFLVGGAFAVRHYADIHRDTKDLDLFVRPQDADRVIDACRRAGFDAEWVFSHWLAKIRLAEDCIDVISRGANGLCEVADSWFEHSSPGNLFDQQIFFCPAEETLWMKAYVMERQRCDTADIVHIIRRQGREMDWKRLIALFGPDWELLLCHITLFYFVYPGEGPIPRWVVDLLADQLRGRADSSGAGSRVCRGTLISAVQYLPDVDRFGYLDARLNDPRVKIDRSQIAAWKENVLKADGN
ncbi:MAG TPA: hypothetical protein VG733_09375 [Chthoniobacteraceae bacterium]|nr:hypothetical protein [Chthoniobacteraceae bacterium]